jgi:hypothetical protein
LEWLSSDDVGFEGWRFDYAKVSGTPVKLESNMLLLLLLLLL